MSPSKVSAPDTQDIGRRFASALARRDRDGLRALLGDEVDFRAMTPTRFWESSDPTVVVDDTILGTWFSPPRDMVELVGLDSESVDPVDRVGYRLRLDGPEGTFLVEQQAYMLSDAGRIRWLRIMCTGFLATDD